MRRGDTRIQCGPTGRRTSRCKAYRRARRRLKCESSNGKARGGGTDRCYQRLPRLEGRPLSELPTVQPSVINAVLRAILRLNETGVCHGDLHPGNILVDANDKVLIIDWDHATVNQPCVWSGLKRPSLNPALLRWVSDHGGVGRIRTARLWLKWVALLARGTSRDLVYAQAYAEVRRALLVTALDRW